MTLQCHANLNFKAPVQFTLQGSCTINIFKVPLQFTESPFIFKVSLQFTDSPFVVPSLTDAGPHDARQ
jgi:hypothetical protein